LSLLGASVEVAANLTAVSGSILYMVKIGKRVEIAEVVKGRVLSTTRPEFLYVHIRELIREAYKRNWIISRLDF